MREAQPSLVRIVQKKNPTQPAVIKETNCLELNQKGIIVKW